MLSAVVGAEQQFTVLHDDPDVSLGTTGIAAVGCGELVGGALLVFSTVVYSTILGGELGHILLLQTLFLEPFY
jgi:hypothetical protein